MANKKDRELTEEIRKYILNAAMGDVLKFSTIALPIIMFFEVYMIANWIINFEHTFEVYSFSYLVAYTCLLIVSGVVWIYTIFHKKLHTKNDNAFNLIQTLYGFIFIVWALVITYQDQTFRDSFSVIIYVTIITIVPLLCYINPRIWALLEIVTYIPMVVMASKEEHFTGFVINFTVFIIISVIAEYSSYNVRRANYIKQFDLEQVQQKDHFYAYHDMDTGLMNRRSFNDNVKELKITDNLVVGIFDIAELKSINTKFGSNLGDQLLNGTAKILSDTFADSGDVYRLGGDDFCVIAHDVPISDTTELIKKKVYDWNGMADSPLKINIGLVSASEMPNSTINEILKEADKRSEMEQ